MEIKRKGIIFALDAALAVAVVIIILINSSYYFSTASKESLSQLQPVRIGSDVIALLDFGNAFDYAFTYKDQIGSGQPCEITPTNYDLISDKCLNVSTYLPKNYALKFTMTDMKETPTSLAICPSSGSDSDCQLGPGTTCTATDCLLDPGEWIKVLPVTRQGTSGAYQQNILNPGKHFVTVGTTRTDAGISLSINVDDNSTTGLTTFDSDTGIYIWSTTVVFPYFEAGNGQNNWINLTNFETQPITVKWVRVVGDESYTRTANSEPGLTVPLDRFIGTGERFISIVEPDGDFEGYHLVRYWIWLKTVSTT